MYKLHFLAISTFVYDLRNEDLPHSLTDYCQVAEHKYMYATRSKDRGQLYLPKCKTTHGQFSISFMGAKLWNCIPPEVKGKK